MGIRNSAVSGQFYPSEKQALLETIEECFLDEIGPGTLPPRDEGESLVAMVCPHAGYIYSGPVAAHSYLAASSMKDVELVVMVGPNHWGIGSAVSTFREGSWRTPLGDVEVDGEVAKNLVEVSGIIDFDEIAHSQEHSLEVQLPFLQYIYKQKYRMVPVSMALQDRTTSQEVGEALAKVLAGRKALLIASSDLTHYESHETARRKDMRLIEDVLKLDLTSYYSTLERLNVTACGYGAIYAVMTAARRLGAKGGMLLKYATSGDTAGDKRSVVGYPSIVFL